VNFVVVFINIITAIVVIIVSGSQIYF